MTKRNFLIFSTLILLSTALAFFGISRAQNWNDYSGYLLQAHGILQGSPQWAVDLVSWGSSHSGIPESPNAYPWAYPLLIAPVVAAFGNDVLAVKMLNIPAFALFMLFFWLFLRQRDEESVGLAPFALIALSPVILGWLDLVGAEALFMLFLYAALWQYSRYEKAPTPTNAILLGLLAFATMATRTIGAVTGVLLLVPLVQVRQLGWRQSALLLALGIAAMAIPFLGYASTFPGGESSYVSFLSLTTPASIASMAATGFLTLREFFKPFWLGVGLFWSVIPASLISLVWLARKAPLQAGMLLAYFAVIAVYPYDGGFRFLFPILPLLLLFLARAIRQATSAAPGNPNGQAAWQKGILAVTIGIAIVLAASSAVISAREAFTNMQKGRPGSGGPLDDASQQVYTYINANLPADAVIGFYKPRTIMLFTDRLSFRNESCDQLANAGYLLFRNVNKAQGMLSEEQAQACPQFGMELLIKNKAYKFYRVTP